MSDERYDHRTHIRRALRRLEELGDRIDALPDSEHKTLSRWAVGTSTVELRAFLIAEERDIVEAERGDERQEFERVSIEHRRSVRDGTDAEGLS